ncbi:MAG: hypothetical protein AB7H90_03325 [Alphaproteobacteria bacterium]
MAVRRSNVWPPPVYVATFAGGEVCRMSVGAYGPKSLIYDFDKGRRVCCNAIGAERVWKAHREKNPSYRHHRITGEVEWREPTVWHPDTINRLIREAGPATDILAGHFEHDGEVIPDPYFTGEVIKPTRKRASVLDKLLASLDKLTSDELVSLSAEVDARLGVPAE